MATEKEARDAVANGDTLPSGWSFNPAKNPPFFKSGKEEADVRLGTDSAPAAAEPELPEEKPGKGTS